MKILCTICARAGSKGIRNKNLINFFGKPLVKHTLDQAKKIKFFNSIVVSTDSKKIQKVVGSDYSWFLRTKKLSGDKVSKVDVIIDILKRTEKKMGYKFEIVIDLDVTSPLRLKLDIIKAFKIFKKKNFLNLISVSDSSRNPYFNMVEIKNNNVVLCKNSLKITNRQSAPRVYDMNAALYIWKRDILLKNKSIFTKKTGIYLMPKIRSIDIDSILDYKIVKFLYDKHK